MLLSLVLDHQLLLVVVVDRRGIVVDCCRLDDSLLLVGICKRLEDHANNDLMIG